MKGMILDLRFNPGGLLSKAIEISDMFLEGGRIVSTKGRTSPERVWDAEKNGTVGDFPVVVVINEFSASASEIVSGALRDNDRAVVLGTRSFGKGSVQQVLGLRSGAGAVKLTTAYYYLPSGRNLHKRPGAEMWGVDPSDGFYVPMNADQIRKMNEVRRESDIIRADGQNGDVPDRVTPQWLREKRSDLQLAAALEAMLAKLETGEWKKVGGDNATLVAHVTEREMLEQQRKRGMEALAKIDERLKELDNKIAKLKGGDAADAKDADKPKPDANAKADKGKKDAAKEPAPANN